MADPWVCRLFQGQSLVAVYEEAKHASATTAAAAAAAAAAVGSRSAAQSAWDQPAAAASSRKRRAPEPVAESHHATAQAQAQADHNYNANSGNANTGEADDDDNAPYCFCRHPSFGEMVGCECDACPFQWFHFGCVGLQRKPRGQWYCYACIDAGRVRNKNKTKMNSMADLQRPAVAARKRVLEGRGERFEEERVKRQKT
jgi:inhibitor of growth protein 3